MLWQTEYCRLAYEDFKLANRSIEAEDGGQTHRKQQRKRTKTCVRSGVGGACGPESGLSAGLRKEKKQGSRVSGNGRLAEKEKDVGAAAPRPSSLETPERMPVL